MIIVTGASGQLGGAVVERLLDRLPADRIGVSVRSPQKVHALAERGVQVRAGDYDDPESLSASFAGAEQVLLVSGATTGPELVRRHRTAIDACRAAGVGRIVYTSHMGVRPDSAFAPMVDHAATEAVLAESGLAHTALRNGFYASSALMLLGTALDTGEIVAPQDGPVAWTTHADLAEAAAVVLADEGRFDGPTPPLTAGEAVDLDALAAIATRVTGRPVRRTVVTDDEYRDVLVARGLPPEAAGMLLGIFVAARQGDFAAVDKTLEEITGHPPLTMHDVLSGRA